MNDNRFAWALACVVLVACAAEPTPSEFVSPVFGNGCALTECGPHGLCVESPDGTPKCECEVGYAGVACEGCETGFHRDFHDRCLADETCAQQPADPCGEHGMCLDQEGVISCACDNGYEGPRCNLCAQEFARDELGLCLPLFVGSGGMSAPPPEECELGYTGVDCSACADGYHASGELCEVDQVCMPNSCPPSSSCSIVAHEIACQCDFGYLAPTCSRCADGYVLVGDTCEPEASCDDACPAHASCSVVLGDAVCQCDAAYVGENCELCASGYHLASDGSCVIDETCGDGSCPPNATCSALTGVVECACIDGYAGAGCAECASGFHRRDGACVPDEICESTTCATSGSCVVVDGETQCACEDGWGDERCDRCVDLATESTAFEFVTGWPTVANVCGGRDELSISRLSLRSLGGTSPVHLCAQSTFHALHTQHVELQAGPESSMAELAFWQPVMLLSFDYATRFAPLALDVVADGIVVASLELPAHFSDSLTLPLDPPAMTVGLRSRSSSSQSVALDNIVYHYEACR